MIVNVISNIRNEGDERPLYTGLQRDHDVLRRLLVELGCEVRAVNIFTDPMMPATADLNIYLETLHQGRYLNAAKESWFFPNCEWYFPEWDCLLPRISKVFCKTPDAFRIWSRKVTPDKCLYSAFESRDLYNPTIAKEPRFLHVAGKSSAKGTELLMQAWRSMPYYLTVVTCGQPGPYNNGGEAAQARALAEMCRHIPSVEHRENVSETELADLMNRCRFVIAPSFQEGHGHSPHEALGCKAVLLTTNAPSMSEFNGIDKRLLLPVERQEPRLLTRFNFISPLHVREVVEYAGSLPNEELDKIGGKAREGFLEDRSFFRLTIKKMIEELA